MANLHLLTGVRLGFVAWMAGLAAYAGALALLHGEWISGGDLQAAALSSFVAFGLCYWTLFLPVLRAVRRRLPPSPPDWVFPLIASLLGIVPTALVARFQGGSLRALLTPETGLFYILFAVAGVVTGLGFARLEAGGTAQRGP